MGGPPSRADPVVTTRERIAAALERGRHRTLRLLEPVSAADQRRQVSPLMSPLCWDLAHIGHYEELWLLRQLVGAPPTDELFDDVYDAFKHPRRDRPSLPILDPPAARQFVADVRKRALDVLAHIDLDDGEPLLADGFVYGMVVQHEHQHDETILATLQLMDDVAHPDADAAPARAAAASAVAGVPSEVGLPGGTFLMGTSDDPWAYDNERPAHEVTVPPFRIDTIPVTNATYLEFVEAGGYDDPRHWSPEGWSWRTQAGLVAPEFWRRDGPGSWAQRRYGRWEDLPPHAPVQHVCWYEADAFARFAGRRLPTEAEWELAASWTPDGHKRRYPWGDGPPEPARANLWAEGPHRYAPSPVGSLPGGASAWGVHQLVGDVWEWTASDFRPYPGFRSFPYREYSEVFFGSDYKVLRGGSWATHPEAMRSTFRNWDFPIRRQIFAGFRCARDD
jgi:iron(II)-dependent oxidoreductase